MSTFKLGLVKLSRRVWLAFSVGWLLAIGAFYFTFGQVLLAIALATVSNLVAASLTIYLNGEITQHQQKVRKGD